MEGLQALLCVYFKNTGCDNFPPPVPYKGYSNIVAIGQSLKAFFLKSICNFSTHTDSRGG